VSKTPVREALLRLQTIGLVIPEGNRRSRVVEPSERLIDHAYEVRSILEAAICRIAAARAEVSDCVAIREAATNSLTCAKADDYAGFRHWDAIFHRRTAAATHNDQLAVLAENALTLTSVLRERDIPSIGLSVKCGRRHVQIAVAIRRGNEDAAADLSIVHVTEVREMLMNELHSRPADTERARRAQT
jgi:GntR family transcriptional regulator, rspAB operon transcriptional repressor